MTDVKDQVDELYHFRDHYFESHTLDKAKEKAKDVESKLKDVVDRLETINLEGFSADAKNEETMFLLQKGRAINILPDHDQRAEDCLSKAVKRNPKSWQAWNELGMCYWKKGELLTAKNCFEGALKQERNKVSLQSLSMILRQLGKTPDEKLNNIYQSLEIAKEALQLDMRDGLSWYCLGNANLNLFFLANQNTKILKQSMQAYSKALEDKVARTHPDLHLNQATALRYEGAYQEALDSYKRATAYDPLWSEPEEKSKELVRYLEQIGTMTKQKGCLKARQLRSMVKSIKPHHIGPYGSKPSGASTTSDIKLREKKMLSQLKEGANPGVIIVGKVVCHIPNPVPFTFCMIDEDETCVAVSVYNQADGKGVVIGDSVAIPDPFVQHVSVSCDDKKLEFTNIRLSSPVTLAVNGRLISEFHAPATVSVTCKGD